MNDLKSILPEFIVGKSPEVSRTIQVGDKVPDDERLSFPLKPPRHAIVAFVRHCGCPFAEQTVRYLVDAANKDNQVYIVVVTHASDAESKQWLQQVLEAVGDTAATFTANGRFRLISDPDRTLYAKWGIGQIGFMDIFGTTSLRNVFRLSREEGIANRATATGSNRYQNSGSFAVDKDGVVQWAHIANNASDVSPIGQGAAKL